MGASPQESTNHFAQVAALVVAYCSTCCNPITYCFLNEKFRHAFLYAFGCGTYVDRVRMKRADVLITALINL